MERQERIDSFNSDPSIFAFLLSTRAGGLGINLVCVWHVYVYAYVCLYMIFFTAICACTHDKYKYVIPLNLVCYYVLTYTRIPHIDGCGHVYSV